MAPKRSTTRAALYLRVSTGEQTTQNQREALTETAQRRGWEVVEVYEDAGVSGAKGRDGRPDLDRMLKDAGKRRRFDVVMVWALDRLGRSVVDLCGNVKLLQDVGVDIYVDQQHLDTTTPSGKLLFHVTAAFAEFERDMIRERVHAGLARARREGKTLGRPKADPKVVAKVRTALAAGLSVRKAAKAAGVSVGLAHKISSDHQAA